ncbi:hypothetical protein BGZ76_009154 [Entomortierella beljakovae]|nr:hypothetical protein BGZ76_009154 [Entomortierella beljakovae]
MPPKRAKAADSLNGVKRSKQIIYDSSNSGLNGTTKSQTKNTFRIDLPELFGENNELLVRNYKPQPKPKPKKTLSSNPPLQESLVTKSQSTQQKPATQAKKNGKDEKDSFDDQENREYRVLSDIKPNNSTTAKKSSSNEKPPSKSSSMSPEQLAVAFEDISAKYKRLRQLRETDAEKNLEEFRSKLEESTQSAENYRSQIEPQLESALRTQEKLRDSNVTLSATVRTLQRKVRECEEQLKQRDEEDKVKAKVASMESILASPDVTPTTVGFSSTIKMFENLAGLKIIPRDVRSKDSLPKVWDCEYTGPRGTLRFTLTYDYAENKVSYTPSLDETRDKKLLEILPDYLTDELIFDRQFESKFFWRILSFHHETPKDREDS